MESVAEVLFVAEYRWFLLERPKAGSAAHLPTGPKRGCSAKRLALTRVKRILAAAFRQAAGSRRATHTLARARDAVLPRATNGIKRRADEGTIGVVRDAAGFRLRAQPDTGYPFQVPTSADVQRIVAGAVRQAAGLAGCA